MDISSMFMIIEDPCRDIGKKFSLESILFMVTAAIDGKELRGAARERADGLFQSLRMSVSGLRRTA